MKSQSNIKDADLKCESYFVHFFSGFLFSVITMKSALANTWECAYLLLTTACLSDQFLRIKPGRVYWKILAKLQVKF